METYRDIEIKPVYGVFNGRIVGYTATVKGAVLDSFQKTTTEIKTLIDLYLA